MLAALFASLPVCTTPGPNNIIAAAIGARHGAARALPYAIGATIGFPLMLAVIGFGLGNIIRLYPQLQLTIQIVGMSFLTYLAYRIATAPVVDQPTQTTAIILGFRHALFFQWINPKAVSFAFSLIALYTRPQHLLIDIIGLMILSAVLTFFTIMLWAFTGGMLKQFLHHPQRQRLFNRIMGFLVLSAAISILIENLL